MLLKDSVEEGNTYTYEDMKEVEVGPMEALGVAPSLPESCMMGLWSAI